MSGHSLWSCFCLLATFLSLEVLPFRCSTHPPVGGWNTTFQLRSPNSCRVACTLLDHMAEKCEKPTAKPGHLEEKKSCVRVICLRCFFHLASEFLNHRFFRRYEFHIECSMAFNSIHTWHQAVQLKTRAPNPPEKRCVAEISPRSCLESFLNFLSRSNAWNEMGCNKNCNNLF